MSPTPISAHEATIRTIGMLAEHPIAGLRTPVEVLLTNAQNSMPGFTVRFERTWGAECMLSLKFTTVTERIKIQKKVYFKQQPQVRVTWPSTGMDPLHALVAVSLFKEVADLAALMQVLLDREIIVDMDLAK